MKKVLLVLGVMLLAAGAAYATPSTQIWIPSTDVQPFKKVHFGFDTYMKARPTDGTTREPNTINNGITVGVLPFEKVQMEVGIDQRTYGVEPYDSAPIYFNAKIGVPEDGLFKYSPNGPKRYTQPSTDIETSKFHFPQ